MQRSKASRDRASGAIGMAAPRCGIRRLLLLASLAGWVAVACGAPLQLRYEADLERADASQRHAVHDERLRQLMRSLDRLSNERLPKSLDVETERRLRTHEVAEGASALAESADQISESADLDHLSRKERADFDELVELLRERSLSLADEASTLSVDAMNERLEEIDEICESCHDRFRPDELP